MSAVVRNIGLFGGSFNPPHVCHTLATLWALQTHGLDEVWWAPTYQHAFGKELVSFEARMEMCRLATRDLRHVEILEIERELGGESRTIDTVMELQSRHPHDHYWLIVGTDILKETYKWKQWDELMERVSLLVVGRKGHMDVEEHMHQDLHQEFSLPRVSSTAIRQAFQTSASDKSAFLLDSWMVSSVRAYVDEHCLYA